MPDAGCRVLVSVTSVLRQCYVSANDTSITGRCCNCLVRRFVLRRLAIVWGNGFIEMFLYIYI